MEGVRACGIGGRWFKRSRLTETSNRAAGRKARRSCLEAKGRLLRCYVVMFLGGMDADLTANNLTTNNLLAPPPPRPPFAEVFTGGESKRQVFRLTASRTASASISGIL